MNKVVLVNETEIKKAMSMMLSDLHLMVEPAGAVALAAVLNPLKQELKNKKVGVIVCGSNIDLNTYLDHIGSPLS